MGKIVIEELEDGIKFQVVDLTTSEAIGMLETYKHKLLNGVTLNDKKGG